MDDKNESLFVSETLSGAIGKANAAIKSGSAIHHVMINGMLHVMTPEGWQIWWAPKYENELPVDQQSLIFRLRKRAEIRRQAQGRKSVAEGKPDRLSDLLEEAAHRLEKLESSSNNSISVYGFCPTCYAPGKTRERRPNGNDTCENGHTYPSKFSLMDPK